MSESNQSSRVSGIKVALAVVPALLIVSICVALYLGANADKEESKPYEGEVTVEEMTGYLANLKEVIGERKIDTEEGQLAYRQLRAMILGALGPQNLGYETSLSQLDSANGLLWPTIRVEAGNRGADEVVVLAVPQAGNGTGVAFALGFAEYLASQTTLAEVRIVFYPPFVSGDFADWIWKRCGDESRELRGVVKVSGGDPGGRFTVFAGPGEAMILRELKESKLWDERLSLATKPTEEFEVRLVEEGSFSKTEQARLLIRLFPVMKNFLDRLAR